MEFYNILTLILFFSVAGVGTTFTLLYFSERKKEKACRIKYKREIVNASRLLMKMFPRDKEYPEECYTNIQALCERLPAVHKKEYDWISTKLEKCKAESSKERVTELETALRSQKDERAVLVKELENLLKVSSALKLRVDELNYDNDRLHCAINKLKQLGMESVVDAVMKGKNVKLNPINGKSVMSAVGKLGVGKMMTLKRVHTKGRHKTRIETNEFDIADK